MKNKLITVVLATSLISPVAISQANAIDNSPVLAILDTGIDTSLPQFKDKIVGEVCILEWALCPNGTNFQEGPGAASMSPEFISKNGFDHGTMMTDIALKNNPNAKVLFIKIIANSAAGMRQPTGESTISAALLWIKDNAPKYNIKAVSISQGSSGLLGPVGTAYCPVFPRTESAIKDLLNVNIPVFSAVGNSRSYTRIDWPSCIPDVVSVGAVDQINEITTYSNNDSSLLDFFALGNITAAGPNNVMKNVAGTSASTQIAAMKYLEATAKFNLSGQPLIDKLKTFSKKTVGRQGTYIKLLSLDPVVGVNAPTVVDNKAAADAKAKADADALAAKAAADAKAKAELRAKLQADANAAIAAAQSEYDASVKAAADKLAVIKANWLSKLNG
jgi:hypothetical protein